jgi:hypothetical protein
MRLLLEFAGRLELVDGGTVLDGVSQTLQFPGHYENVGATPAGRTSCHWPGGAPQLQTHNEGIRLVSPW